MYCEKGLTYIIIIYIIYCNSYVTIKLAINVQPVSITLISSIYSVPCFVELLAGVSTSPDIYVITDILAAVLRVPIFQIEPGSEATNYVSINLCLSIPRMEACPLCQSQ